MPVSRSRRLPPCRFHWRRAFATSRTTSAPAPRTKASMKSARGSGLRAPLPPARTSGGPAPRAEEGQAGPTNLLLHVEPGGVDPFGHHVRLAVEDVVEDGQPHV